MKQISLFISYKVEGGTELNAKRLEKVGSSFVGGISDIRTHGCEKAKTQRFSGKYLNRKSNGNLISQLKICLQNRVFFETLSTNNF